MSDTHLRDRARALLDEVAYHFRDAPPISEDTIVAWDDGHMDLVKGLGSLFREPYSVDFPISDPWTFFWLDGETILWFLPSALRSLLRCCLDEAVESAAHNDKLVIDYFLDTYGNSARYRRNFEVLSLEQLKVLKEVWEVARDLEVDDDADFDQLIHSCSTQIAKKSSDESSSG